MNKFTIFRPGEPRHELLQLNGEVLPGRHARFQNERRQPGQAVGRESEGDARFSL